MQQLCYLVPAQCEGARLTVFLREQGVTAGTIKAVKYRGGGFFADGVPVHTDHVVRAGERIAFALPPEASDGVTPEPMELCVAYEDDFAAVVDKPAGLAVHPTLNYPAGTLANGWAYRMRQRGEPAVFRPVNRLDKNTSGLVLCAKNAFAAPALAATADKRYVALVQGRLEPPCGQIDAPIGRRGDSIIGRCVRPDGKPSATRYRVLAQSGAVSLVLCRLLTGRTHQIRVHMAHIGHPLAGDSLYGGDTGLLARHALHCAALRFRHPVSGESVEVCSPLPEDLLACCRAHLGPADELLHGLFDFT